MSYLKFDPPKVKHVQKFLEPEANPPPSLKHKGRFGTSREFILPLNDEYFRMFLVGDRRLRTIACQTNCDITLTKRILNRVINGRFEKFAIINIHGPSARAISTCNRLIEKQFPEYSERIPYQSRSTVTFFTSLEVPDNLELASNYQRTASCARTFAGLELMPPLGETEQRPDSKCPWRQSGEKQGYFVPERQYLESLLGFFHHDQNYGGEEITNEDLHALADQLMQEIKVHRFSCWNGEKMDPDDEREFGSMVQGLDDKDMSKFIDRKKESTYPQSMKADGSPGNYENEDGPNQSPKSGSKYAEENSRSRGTSSKNGKPSSSHKSDELSMELRNSKSKSKAGSSDPKLSDANSNSEQGWKAMKNKTHREELELDQVEVRYTRQHVVEYEDSLAQLFTPTETTLTTSTGKNQSNRQCYDFYNSNLSDTNLSKATPGEILEDVWVNCQSIIPPMMQLKNPRTTSLTLNRVSQQSCSTPGSALSMMEMDRSHLHPRERVPRFGSASGSSTYAGFTTQDLLSSQNLFASNTSMNQNFFPYDATPKRNGSTSLNQSNQHHGQRLGNSYESYVSGSFADGSSRMELDL